MDAKQATRRRTGQRGASIDGNTGRRTGQGADQRAPSDDHYVSLAVAADLVGVSVKTLRRRITAHILPAYRLGGGRATRVSLHEVRDALLGPYDEA